MIGITPERFADELKSAYFAPSEEYSRAFWSQEMIYLTSEVKGIFEREFHSSLNFIRKEGLTSDEFRIERPVKDFRSVNMALLKEERPDVYSSQVYVSNADVVKLFGGSKPAYAAVREKCGSRIDSVEFINLKELESVLTPCEQARYIKCESQETGTVRVIRL